MRKIALMPLRSGSKGVVDKNVREFNGKPLFYWNLKALLDSRMFDLVFVSTDSDRYASIVADNFMMGYEVLIDMRPERLSRDSATTIRLVQGFIEFADLEDVDIFALTQATSPYLSVEDIKYSFAMLNIGQCDSVMSVGRMKRFLWTWDGEGINVAKDRHQRRQDWRGSLVQNGCFYLTTAELIRDTGMLWGGSLGFVEQPYWFDIDTEADFVYGEEVMRA